jgi:hypothetical protein
MDPRPCCQTSGIPTSHPLAKASFLAIQPYTTDSGLSKSSRMLLRNRASVCMIWTVSVIRKVYFHLCDGTWHLMLQHRAWHGGSTTISCPSRANAVSSIRQTAGRSQPLRRSYVYHDMSRLDLINVTRHRDGSRNHRRPEPGRSVRFWREHSGHCLLPPMLSHLW